MIIEKEEVLQELWQSHIVEFNSGKNECSSFLLKQVYLYLILICTVKTVKKRWSQRKLLTLTCPVLEGFWHRNFPLQIHCWKPSITSLLLIHLHMIVCREFFTLFDISFSSTYAEIQMTDLYFHIPKLFLFLFLIFLFLSLTHINLYLAGVRLEIKVLEKGLIHFSSCIFSYCNCTLFVPHSAFRFITEYTFSELAAVVTTIF